MNLPSLENAAQRPFYEVVVQLRIQSVIFKSRSSLLRRDRYAVPSSANGPPNSFGGGSGRSSMITGSGAVSCASDSTVGVTEASVAGTDNSIPGCGWRSEAGSREMSACSVAAVESLAGSTVIDNSGTGEATGFEKRSVPCFLRSRNSSKVRKVICFCI